MSDSTVSMCDGSVTDSSDDDAIEEKLELDQKEDLPETVIDHQTVCGLTHMWCRSKTNWPEPNASGTRHVMKRVRSV